MTFSIIISTKDRPVDLQHTVKSIAKQTCVPDELIIVDASSDNIRAENKKNCEINSGVKIKLVYIESAPGVNKQRNLGAENANSDIIFFLDDDVVLNEDYSEKIMEVYKLKGDQNLGGVQGCILNYYNQTWINRNFKKIFFMTRTAVNERSRFLPSLGYVFICVPKTIIEVEAMPSLICSYYREKFNEFRFDELFERCTDLELSFRVSRKYKLYQTPFAIATHYHSEDTHLNIKKLNMLYVIYTHKMIKKHLTKKASNWLAYSWSIVGEVILSAAKSLVKFSPESILGTMEGLKVILTGADNSPKKQFKNY